MTDSLNNQNHLHKRVQELEVLVETISKSKTMWESTFDVISDPVLVVDSQYQIKRANLGFAQITGTDIKKIPGQKCYELFAGYTGPCPGCPLKNLSTRTDDELKRIELERFPKNGRQYEVSAYALPEVASATGDEVVLYYRDVTDERQLQRRLRQAEKMAAVGTLAGGVAHEINNPLGGILAFTQLALKQLDQQHPAREDLVEVERAVLRCKNIVQNLLDYSRQDLHEPKKQISLNDVVKNSQAYMDLSSKEYEVQVQVNLQEDLPLLVGQSGPLQQVFLNLFTNALQAVDKGSGEIYVSTQVKDGLVSLQIKDNGCGMNPEEVDRIFEPYFTTKKQGEGTGLGLSICYKIVHEHHGKIQVESKKGEGTIMSLVFPQTKGSRV